MPLQALDENNRWNQRWPQILFAERENQCCSVPRPLGKAAHRA